MRTLIVSLNPAIDAEWCVDGVLWEEKNNVLSGRRWAGGKGANVARWLKHLGGNPLLLLPLGGQTGDELAAHLREEQLPATIIPLREPTRVNVVLTTPSGRQMRFNPPGPTLSRPEWSAVLKAVERSLARVGLLILSGSLPRGVPMTAYARLIRLARRAGVRTLLDCDGPAFAAAARARPFLVKPNAHELAQWRGRPLRSESAARRAARDLSAQTGGWVLVSRGAKRSLLLNRKPAMQFAVKPPATRPRNTVGAGDTMLATVARQIELGAPPQTWLRLAAATAAAATQCPPGHLPQQ